MNSDTTAVCVGDALATWTLIDIQLNLIGAAQVLCSDNFGRFRRLHIFHIESRAHRNLPFWFTKGLYLGPRL